MLTIVSQNIFIDIFFALVMWVMVYYASSPICNMCVYISFQFNPTTFSVFKEAELSTLLWLIWSCRWCQPWNDLFSWVELMIFQWKNSGKWILSDMTCPIPRSIMNSEGRVILGYRLFSKTKYLYNSKSQFSHADLLFYVIERVQLWNCLIFFHHHWHFNILLFLLSLFFCFL